MIANRVSGRATVVLDAKMRMCVVRASSRPPPNAGAASADIVGMGSCDMEAKVPRRVVRKFAVLRKPVSRNAYKDDANSLFLGKCSPLFQVGACAEACVYFTSQNQCPRRPRFSFIVYAVDMVV
jgi:hypothetical protein